jgi:ABC-type nitrate/sulfonate/bicarbonate transport system permease component
VNARFLIVHLLASIIRALAGVAIGLMIGVMIGVMIAVATRPSAPVVPAIFTPAPLPASSAPAAP